MQQWINVEPAADLFPHADLNHLSAVIFVKWELDSCKYSTYWKVHLHSGYWELVI